MDNVGFTYIMNRMFRVYPEGLELWRVFGVEKEAEKSGG